MPRGATSGIAGAAVFVLVAAASGRAEARTIDFWPSEGRASSWPYAQVYTDLPIPADHTRVHLTLNGAQWDLDSHLRSVWGSSFDFALGTLLAGGGMSRPSMA